MAVWDAAEHIPARLAAEFGEEKAERHIGGPIWRERRIKEERAARFADQRATNCPTIGSRLTARSCERQWPLDVSRMAALLLTTRDAVPRGGAR